MWGWLRFTCDTWSPTECGRQHWNKWMGNARFVCLDFSLFQVFHKLPDDTMVAFSDHTIPDRWQCIFRGSEKSMVADCFVLRATSHMLCFLDGFFISYFFENMQKIRKGMLIVERIVVKLYKGLQILSFFVWDMLGGWSLGEGRYWLWKDLNPCPPSCERYSV